jgi:hypothetical protein
MDSHHIDDGFQNQQAARYRRDALQSEKRMSHVIQPAKQQTGRSRRPEPFNREGLRRKRAVPDENRLLDEYATMPRM